MARPQAVTFQFITSINTVTHDEETRRKVRSHARRQKLPNDSNSPPTQARKSCTQKERISKFRIKPGVQLTNTSEGDSAKRNGPVTSNAVLKKSSGPKQNAILLTQPADVRGDDTNMTPISPDLTLVVARELPNFPMLRIETTPLTENLLKYCFTVCLCPREAVIEKWFDRAGAPTYMMTYYTGFLANAFAMNPEGNFFDALHVDTAITHAFMAMVASMHNSLAQWSDTSTFDFHRLHAIKAINKRLNIEGKNPGVPISDGITMAVALLVNNETFTGSIEAAAAHIAGLNRIVDMRGGILEGFKHINVIQRALVWADFSYAYAAGKPLTFPFVPQLATPLSLHYRFQGRSTENIIENPEPKTLIIRHGEIVEIYELLYAITDCLGSFDYNNLENMSTERLQLSDSIYLAEWRLFRLEQSYRNFTACNRGSALALNINDYKWEMGGYSIDLSESLMFAAHIFLHLALRGQPPAAPRHRVITESLISSLYKAVLTLDLLSTPKPPCSPKSYYSTSCTGSTYSAASTSVPCATSIPPVTSIAGITGNSTAESWSTSSNASTLSSSPAEGWSPATSASSPLSIHSTDSEDDFAKNALLWALFVGSCVRTPTEFQGAEEAAMHGGQRPFFVLALKNYCLMRGIADKETLVMKLKDVIWLPHWCNNQVDMLWADMGDYLA